MFYDEIDAESDQKQMKMLGTELQEQIETCPSEIVQQELLDDYESSSKCMNPLKSTEKNLEDDDWDSYFTKPN